MAGRKFAQSIFRSYFMWYTNVVWGEIQFEGKENLPSGEETCIYVGNHQTSVDFVVGCAIPNGVHMIAVAKDTLMFLPGMGAMMALCGTIYVKRGKKGTMAMLLEEGKKRLKDGHSIGIFPQGTRQIPRHDTPLKPFRMGAFSLAVEAKVKIVPITVIYPVDFMTAKPSFPGFKIKVHPPLEPGNDAEAMMKQVEKIVLEPILKQYPKCLPPVDAKAGAKSGDKKSN